MKRGTGRKGEGCTRHGTRESKGEMGRGRGKEENEEEAAKKGECRKGRVKNKRGPAPSESSFRLCPLLPTDCAHLHAFSGVCAG